MSELIVARGLGKSFGTTRALDDVSFHAVKLEQRDGAKVATVEVVLRGEVECPEERTHREVAELAGFHIADGADLVLHDVVFVEAEGKLLFRAQAEWLPVLRIAGFVHAQHDQVEGQGQQKNRCEQE